MGSRGNWQSRQRVRVLTEVSSPGSLLRGLVESKVQFHVVPSFPNPDGQEKIFVRMRSLNRDLAFRCALVGNLSLPGTVLPVLSSSRDLVLIFSRYKILKFVGLIKNRHVFRVISLKFNIGMQLLFCLDWLVK